MGREVCLATAMIADTSIMVVLLLFLKIRLFQRIQNYKSKAKLRIVRKIIIYLQNVKYMYKQSHSLVHKLTLVLIMGMEVMILVLIIGIFPLVLVREEDLQEIY